MWGFLSIPEEWLRKHSNKSSIISFFPALISLGNDQTHLHHRNIGRLKDLIEIPQEFPRKMWEINQVYLSYLENEGHLSDLIP